MPLPSKEQWGKMGLSVDYSHEAFPLDEGLSKSCSKVFVVSHKKGWIYRGGLSSTGTQQLAQL